MQKKRNTQSEQWKTEIKKRKWKNGKWNNTDMEKETQTIKIKTMRK